PATIGETEKGISITTTSRRLPGNSNLVMAQAAATPNAVLMGTAISAVATVMKMACRVSGCAIVSAKVFQPLENAWAKITTSGATTSTAPVSRTKAMRLRRTAGLSPTRGGLPLRSALSISGPPRVAQSARLQEVGDGEHYKGGNQHYRGDRSRRLVVIFFEADE